MAMAHLLTASPFVFVVALPLLLLDAAAHVLHFGLGRDHQPLPMAAALSLSRLLDLIDTLFAVLLQRSRVCSSYGLVVIIS